MDLLFENANLLLRGGEAAQGSVGVSNGLITFVGQKPDGFIPDEVIDCQGDLLMPGLVDTHTHMPMSLLRGVGDDTPLAVWLSDHVGPLESQMDDFMIEVGARLALAELIRGGVTAVNDMHLIVQNVAGACEKAGMRALLSRGIMSFSQVENLAETQALLERYRDPAGLIRIAVAPHAEYTNTTESLLRSRELAQKYGAPLHIHVSETKKEHEECKERHGGMSPVRYLDSLGLLDERSLLAHCVWVEEEDVELIAARGASVLHCPQSNLKLGSGIAPVARMLEKGVCVTVATDGAASNNNLDMFEEMRLAALLAKGSSCDPELVPAKSAFAMATEYGAKALGYRGGVLEAGYAADLILLDLKKPHMQPVRDLLSNLVYAAGAGDVRMTMVNGRMLYRDGQLLTIDEEQLSRDVQTALERFA